LAPRSTSSPPKAANAAKNGGLFGGSGLDPFRLALRGKSQGFEAEVRQAAADRLRIIREQTRSAEVQKAAESFLFGDPQKAKNSFVKRAEELGKTLKLPELSALQDAVADATAKAGKSPEVVDATRGSGRRAAEEIEKGFIDRLKSGNKTIKTFTKLFFAGGAVGGIGFLAGELKDAVDQAMKLREEFQKGEISAGELTNKIAQSLPVIGSIVGLGASIREVMDGEQAALAAARSEAEDLDHLTSIYRDSWKQITDLHERSAIATERIRQETELLRQQPGPQSFSRIGVALSQTAEDATRQATADIAEKTKALADEKLRIVKQQQSIVIPEVRTEAVSGGEGGRGTIVSNEREVADIIQRHARLGLRIKQIDADIAKERAGIEADLQDNITALAERSIDDRARNLFQRAGDSARDLIGRFVASGEESRRRLAEEQRGREENDRRTAGAVFVNRAQVPDTATAVQSRSIAGIDQLGRGFDENRKQQVQTNRTLADILRELINHRPSSGGFNLQPF
jgi:hypothetical protein